MTDWLNPALKISETTKKKIYAMQSGKKQYFVMPHDVYDKKFLPLAGSTLSAKVRWNKAIINYLPELYMNGPRFDTLQDARKYIFAYTLKEYNPAQGKYGGGRIFCNKPHEIAYMLNDDPWRAWEIEDVYTDMRTQNKSGEWNRKVMSAMHMGKKLQSYFIDRSGRIVAHNVYYPKKRK